MAKRKHDKPEDTIINACPADPEVCEEFDNAQHRAGSGGQLLRRKLKENPWGPLLSGGDIDADWQDAEYVGEEAITGDNPTPDQSLVDEIGRAVGEEQDDGKPLRLPIEKYRAVDLENEDPHKKG